MRRQCTAILFSVAVLCGACGGDDSGSEAAAGDESYESPLAEYVGGMSFGGDPAEMQAQFEDQQRQVNERVTECMAAEGFEWLPDAGPVQDFTDVGSDGLEYGSDEWTAKWGFGMSTQAFPQASVGPDLLGMDESAMGMEEEDYVDPNAEYLDSLSEAERQAYSEALYGGEDNGPAIDESMTEEEMDAAFQEWQATHEPTGCMNIAQEGKFSNQDFYMEFGEDLEEMYSRIEADPRIVEANAEIAECMADKGLTFTTMQDVQEDIWSRLEPMQRDIYSEEAFGLAEEVEGESDGGTAATTVESNFSFPELSDEAKAELAEIQAEEIEMAVAVNECGGGYRGQEELYREVSQDLEAQFVEENKGRLEEYKASQEQAANG